MREDVISTGAFGGGNDGKTAQKFALIKENLIELITTVIRSAKGSPEKLPVICIFGQKGVNLVTPTYLDYEEKRLDCRCFSSDTHLERVLIQDRPHVIVTIGNLCSFPNLTAAPFEIRKRWLHYDSLPDLSQLGTDVYSHYLTTVFNDTGADDHPLVTVFTPTYRAGKGIYRPFLSLRKQTYTNWEWIIVDDSDDGGDTLRMVTNLAKEDHRIRVFKPSEHSGIIGKVKNWACSLGKGHILLELDHDDALTDYAIEYVVKGFRQFPKAGFLYTDSAEILEDGTNYTYKNGWAFGYGAYTDAVYKGIVYKSANAPHINAKTIRHIASAPNHIRAWRKSFYESIGGHNKELHVADDYELVVRSFLKTRMVWVPKLCYLQYVGNSTQSIRNKDIQRHVRSIRDHYDRPIHERLLELGCDDFIWDEKRGCSDLTIPNPETESHATLMFNADG
jgi:glycosyltransferase involved in cell wall biosynthesis